MNFQIIKPVYAAICNKAIDPNCSSKQTHDPVSYFSNVIQVVFSMFMIVGIAYFVWHFVMAGYHYMASLGDAKKIEEAKHEITYGFVGLAVVFSTFALLKLIGYVFGISNLESLQLSIPTL